MKKQILGESFESQIWKGGGMVNKRGEWEGFNMVERFEEIKSVRCGGWLVEKMVAEEVG